MPLSIKPFAANEKFSTADFNPGEYPVNFKYFTEYYASIGDSDNTLPNSMAQWFYVDKDSFPKGFNLTGVYAYSTYGDMPTVEIFKGNTLAASAKVAEEIEVIRNGKSTLFQFFFQIISH